MTSLSFKLNAFDGLNDPRLKAFTGINDFNDPRIKEVADLVKAHEAAGENIGYKFIREEEIKNEKGCSHCPKYLLLTEQINKVVDKIAKDPKSSVSNELPVKINRLKFLYYTQALRDQNNDIKCQRFMDITPDLRPTKFDGQFKLIAEDALKFSAVSEIQYMNPNLEEVVYYYRGEGADKDIVVQAILTKGGGKFRYYRYTPSEKEVNPYNLPDMNQTYAGPERAPTPADNVIAPDVAPKASSLVGGTPSALDNYKLKFKTELEKRNRFIPRNLHLIEASMEQEVAAGVSVKGSSDTSVKGNVAHLAVKNGTSDLILVDLDTKLSGATEHRITIPYSLRMLETLPGIAVQGKLQHENNAAIVTMSLTDQAVELVRSEYRRNSTNGKDSFVLARDLQIDNRQTVSMQVGKDEENNKYAALQHVKTLKNNISLVLSVRVDQDKKVNLYYQISGKF